MLKIVGFVIGSVATNVYIVVNEESRECVIIDPADEGKRLIRFIEEKLKARPIAILLTHGHFDHIMAVKILKEHFDIPVYAGENEKEVLSDPDINMSCDYGPSVSIVNYIPLKDGQVLDLLGYPWKVIETPGHTVGSISFYLPRTGDNTGKETGQKSEEEANTDLETVIDPVLFSGDTLFRLSFGRTDFPGGSGAQLQDSIVNKLFVLPDETKVYPGHEEATSIAFEKRYNPINNMGMGMWI